MLGQLIMLSGFVNPVKALLGAGRDTVLAGDQAHFDGVVCCCAGRPNLQRSKDNTLQRPDSLTQSNPQ